MGKKRDNSAAGMDMTPMIDCVFQLIIFFVVTITVDQKLNEDIKLELGKHGPVPEEPNQQVSVIEVDKRGWISIRGTPLSKGQLRDLLTAKYRRLGRAFPILIRGDYRTKHEDIRAVMDICTSINIWKIEFAAIKEKKGG
jgi:biopolymer transport protein ExbD